MARARTPSQIEAKVKSLKSEIGRLEKKRKEVLEAKKKKPVKKKSATKRPKRKSAKKRRR